MGSMSGAHGVSTAASFSGDAVIENAEQVYVAENIIVSNRYQSDAWSEDTDCQDEEDIGQDCGCEQSSESGVCRWTQTRLFESARNGQMVAIANVYNQVDLKINKKAAQAILKAGESEQKIEDAVLKCLARLQWNGETIHTGAMTAWKLQVKEGMDLMYKELLNLVLNTSDYRKLTCLIRELWQKGLRLLGIERGSLVFILEHVTAEDADLMCSSGVDQAAVQDTLLDFLPEWVKEREVLWQVMRCSTPAAVNPNVTLQLSEPIPLIRQWPGDAASMDVRRLERTIEKTLDRHMQSVRRHLTKVQEDAFQRLVQQHTEAMLGVKNFLRSLGPGGQEGTEAHGTLSGSPESPQSLEAGDDHSLETDCGSGSFASDPSRSTPLAPTEHLELALEHPTFTNNKSSETQTSLTMKKTVSEHPGHSLAKRRVRGEEFPRSVTAIAAAAQMVHDSRVAQYPGPSLDSKAVSSMAEDLPLSEKSWADYESSESHKIEELRRDITVPKHSSQLREGSDTKTITRHGHDYSDDVEGKRPFSERKEPSEEEGQDSEDEDDSSSGEGKDAESPKESQQSKTIQAEQLLSWLNVKSRASQSNDPEIQRLLDQVEIALQDEKTESPRAKTLDTILVLDTSDSVVKEHLDELKAVAHTFINGIEDNVDVMNLEENLAVVQMGGRAWVRQHLTNDYSRVRDAIDAMTPSSKKMPVGGKTPMFQALLVCLGAIEGKGGVVNVAGCHRVRPRLIFFTDGRPTDEASDFGPDTQSNVNEVKYYLVQLISEFVSKKHKTTPAPIFWVPIGNNADRPFMESLAALSGGKVVEKENVEELCRYYKVQETIGCVFKMVRKHKEIYETEQQMRSVVNALAGNLDKAEKDYIIEEVRKKQKNPENEPAEADDFDNVFEDTELVEAGSLLPLGTRVKRGPDWKWDNQDTDGPGTVLQHRIKKDGWLYVMWDNGTYNAYRYGDGECDVEKTDRHPRILTDSEMIEIGVQVTRGDDWTFGDEDGNGRGVVIRKRKDGKVKVRWGNGHIGKYKYGASGKMEVKVVTECLPQTQSSSPVQARGEDELGAIGGYDPAEGPVRRVWQWWDPREKAWRMYTADVQDKLLQAYEQRRDGSCVITREGKNRRVLFKVNQEKSVDKGGGILLVQTLQMSGMQYLRMLQEEEDKYPGVN